jgi:hypothetical protein
VTTQKNLKQFPEYPNYPHSEDGMRHADFKIGTEFFTGAGRWRCTDVGTRVITAIRIAEFVTAPATESIPARIELIPEDRRNLLGPPYSVAECVFDEYDLPGCDPALPA